MESYQAELLEKIHGIKDVLLESDLVTGEHFKTLSGQIEDQLLNQFLNQSAMKSPLELEGLIKVLEEGLEPYEALRAQLVEPEKEDGSIEQSEVDYKDFNIDDLLG